MIYFYRDGVLLSYVPGQFTNFPIIQYYNAKVYLGINPGESIVFNGLIDQAMIFPRVLTSSEVTYLTATTLSSSSKTKKKTKKKVKKKAKKKVKK